MEDIIGEWLVPFKGRNHSGAYNQNFLWRRGTVYVMDNHRAALWCWLQHIDPRTRHSMLHIDRHTDTLQSRLDEWRQHLPSGWNMSIDDYLGCAYVMNGFSQTEPTPLFRWDNYLSIYFDQFGESIDRCYFVTHDDGDKPNHQVMEASLWDIPSNLDYWLSNDHRPWIVNIDLDYFFWHAGDDEAPQLMVSDSYLDRLCSVLRQKINDGTVGVTTICLTPDEAFTGGWQPSERLMERILSGLGISFKLPLLPAA